MAHSPHMPTEAVAALPAYHCVVRAALAIVSADTGLSVDLLKSRTRRLSHDAARRRVYLMASRLGATSWRIARVMGRNRSTVSEIVRVAHGQ